MPESGGLKDTVSVLKLLWGEEVNFLEEKKSTLALAGFPSFPGSTYVGGQASRGEGWCRDARRSVVLHPRMHPLYPPPGGL